MANKKVWTPEERKAFGEKMRKAREKAGVCQPKPNTEKPEIPEEVKELSGISKPENVNIFIKNPVSINGISYGGMCNVPLELARILKYRSDLVSDRKRRENDSTDHGFHLIGVMR